MKDGRVGIVLQARMGSQRLPNKSLRPLAGFPLVGHAIERLLRCRQADTLIVATTDLPEDDVLADYARNVGAVVFRGNALDVLSRFRFCSLTFDLDNVVRVTGDNPFVDPEEVDRLIEFHRSCGVDFSQSFSGGLPVGIGAEVMTFSALEKSYREAHTFDQREHVDEFILQNLDQFSYKILPAPAPKFGPSLSFTVDTIHQFQAAERLLCDVFGMLRPAQLTTEMLVAGSHTL